jgi:hypothetical protein
MKNKMRIESCKLQASVGEKEKSGNFMAPFCVRKFSVLFSGERRRREKRLELGVFVLLGARNKNSIHKIEEKADIKISASFHISQATEQVCVCVRVDRDVKRWSDGGRMME